MFALKRRIEKVEEKVQLKEKEANERKAKLLEMQKHGKSDSLVAMLLQLELKHGRRFTLADVAAIDDVGQTKDSHRI
jgi:hypothetical protein